MKQKARKNDSRSEAQKAQQKHWETMGQLASAKSLAQYVMQSNPYLSGRQKTYLETAVNNLWYAFSEEQSKNQFINLNLPRGF